MRYHPDKKTILIIEIEGRIIAQLTQKFTQLGYQVITTCDKKIAFNIFKISNPAFVVLGMDIPALDGYEFCKYIRKYFNNRIIAISSLRPLSNCLLAFEAGVNDYIHKPRSISDVDTWLKQIVGSSGKGLECEQDKILSQFLIINLQKSRIFKEGKKLNLTPIEKKLLGLLINNVNNTLSRPYIISHLWGYTPSSFVENRVVDVYISRLRAKLENTPNNPDFITTVRGQGYTFKPFV